MEKKVEWRVKLSADNGGEQFKLMAEIHYIDTDGTLLLQNPSADISSPERIAAIFSPGAWAYIMKGSDVDELD